MDGFPRLFAGFKVSREALFWLSLQAALIIFFLIFSSAPLASGDSRELLKQAHNIPWFNADWHPLGLSLIFSVWTTLFGENFFFFLFALAFFKQLLIFKLLRRAGASRRCAGILSFFFLAPSWWVIHSTLWSENVFFLCLLGLSWFLFPKPLIVAAHERRLEWGPVRVVAAALCILVAFQVRNAAIFMLPALIVAWIAYSWAHQSLKLKNFLILIFLLFMWPLSNFLATKTLVKPSKNAGFSCVQGMVSLNFMNFCDRPEAQQLCVFDPEFKVLGNSEYDAYDGLGFLQFGATSPYVKFQENYGLAGACDFYKWQLKEIRREYKLEFTKKYLSRLWAQFGGWASHELAPPLASDVLQKNRSSFERILNFQNVNRGTKRHFFVLALLLCLYIVFRFKKAGISFRPGAETFLLLFAFSHAAGIALNNPFSSLRYMEMSQSALLLAILVFFSNAQALGLKLRLWRFKTK